MKHRSTNRLKLASLFLASTLLCSTFPASALELKEHTAVYTAKIKKGVSIDGKAIRSLKKLDNNKWLYTFDVDSFIADIKESSLILEDNNIIQPLEYNYKLSAFLLSDRKRQVHFDWQKKSATNPIRGDQWLLTNIPQNTYDRLSYQLQLLLDVDNQKSPMNYNIAHKGKLRESQFVILGEEEINTRFGKIKSVAAKKQRDEDAKRETLLWFSKDFPLLLLKMTQKEEDGEEYEIELSSAKIEGEKITFESLASKNQ